MIPGLAHIDMTAVLAFYAIVFAAIVLAASGLFSIGSRIRNRGSEKPDSGSSKALLIVLAVAFAPLLVVGLLSTSGGGDPAPVATTKTTVFLSPENPVVTADVVVTFSGDDRRVASGVQLDMPWIPDQELDADLVEIEIMPSPDGVANDYIYEVCSNCTLRFPAVLWLNPLATEAGNVIIEATHEWSWDPWEEDFSVSRLPGVEIAIEVTDVPAGRLASAVVSDDVTLTPSRAVDYRLVTATIDPGLVGSVDDNDWPVRRVFRTLFTPEVPDTDPDASSRAGFRFVDDTCADTHCTEVEYTIEVLGYNNFNMIAALDSPIDGELTIGLAVDALGVAGPPTGSVALSMVGVAEDAWVALPVERELTLDAKESHVRVRIDTSSIPDNVRGEGTAWITVTGPDSVRINGRGTAAVRLNGCDPCSSQFDVSGTPGDQIFVEVEAHYGFFDIPRVPPHTEITVDIDLVKGPAPQG